MTGQKRSSATTSPPDSPPWPRDRDLSVSGSAPTQPADCRRRSELKPSPPGSTGRLILILTNEQAGMRTGAIADGHAAIVFSRVPDSPDVIPFRLVPSEDRRTCGCNQRDQPDPRHRRGTRRQRVSPGPPHSSGSPRSPRMRGDAVSCRSQRSLDGWHHAFLSSWAALGPGRRAAAIWYAHLSAQRARSSIQSRLLPRPPRDAPLQNTARLDERCRKADPYQSCRGLQVAAPLQT